MPFLRGLKWALGSVTARTLLLSACLVLLGIALTACGSSATKQGSATVPVKYAAPNPVDIKVVADNKLASTAVIGSAGGVVTAKGADGTVFTLTFPKGAVGGSEMITLTPVSSADGLPFSGGLAGAV